jgi:hypothetical protein
MRAHFQKHGRGVFTCYICQRRTRMVDQGGDSELCQQCWDLAGLDNTVNDNRADPEICGDWKRHRDDLLAIVVKRGGDARRVKKNFEYLWPEGRD